MSTWIRNPRVVLAAVLVAVLVAAGFVVVKLADHIGKMMIVGYFENSTGLFEGDDVRIRGSTSARSTRSNPRRSARR